MADIFLSYNRGDAVRARQLADLLVEEGFSVWWDNDLTPRQPWDLTTETQIRQAAAVIVLWSPRSIISEWVRAEAYHAYEARKLIPVMIEACLLPMAFQLVQAVDLSTWDGDRQAVNWRKLMGWADDHRLGVVRGIAPGGEEGQVNRFHKVLGSFVDGQPIVDGSMVNAETPAGTLFQDIEGGPVMRVAPRGRFILGASPADPDRSSAEGPQKPIQIARAFAIGAFPVLRSEYDQFRAPQSGPDAWAPLPTRRPNDIAWEAAPDDVATHVSFADAEAFAAQLSAATGQTYRLPSEAEWEYCCRAGGTGRYAHGDQLTAEQAAFRHGGADRPDRPSPPGRFPPNRFGLFDMHGNVREWTADYWHDSYAGTPSDGAPYLDGHAAMRVVRGGAWSDPASMLRASARSRATESFRTDTIGFRLVRVLD